MMEKTIAGLFGAVAALTLTPAQAAVESAAPLPVTSYADLLQPVPNALALQKADDARHAADRTSDDVKMAQVVVVGHHHHHHHHHRYRRGVRVGPVVIERRHRHHHHHHHHHHGYYR